MKTHRMAPEEAFELLTLLHQARDTAGKARQKELDTIDLSMSQAAILYIINAVDGPVNPSEIARWLNREPNTVFSLLRNMEKRGLVRKVKDLEPKNRVRVEITEKGEEMNQLSQEKRQVITRIMSSLAPSERIAMRCILTKIRDKAMREAGMNYQPRFP